jgi:hypothetical protein
MKKVKKCGGPAHKPMLPGDCGKPKSMDRGHHNGSFHGRGVKNSKTAAR